MDKRQKKIKKPQKLHRKTLQKKTYKKITGTSGIKFLINITQIHLKTPNYYKNKKHLKTSFQKFQKTNLSKEIYKYYINRYNLFTKYDSGNITRNKIRSRIMVFCNT